MNNHLPYHQLKRKILFEHLEKYPDAGSNTIARILNRDYPEIYHTIEYARTIIRTYRGKNGDLSRSTIKNKKYYQ